MEILKSILNSISFSFLQVLYINYVVLEIQVYFFFSLVRVSLCLKTLDLERKKENQDPDMTRRCTILLKPLSSKNDLHQSLAEGQKEGRLIFPLTISNSMLMKERVKRAKKVYR